MSTKIWYDHFVNEWLWALPLGNGRIGAMLYGNPDCERIEINEESLWSGRQIKENYHASPEILAKIRGLLFAEHFHEAADLCRQTFLSDPPFVRFFESFGEISVDYLDKSPITVYRKELELSEAIASVSWKKSDATYQSETFVSEDYDALVYRTSTDGHPFSCNITFARAQDAYTAALDPNTIVLNGRITYATEKQYGEGGEGVAFGARLKVVSDGEQTVSEHGILTVKNATCMTVYAAFATNYNVETFDIDETIDYRSRLLKTLNRIATTDYQTIRKKHLESHAKWFGSVQLDLKKTENSDLPTDVRLKRVRRGQVEDPDLFALYYQFGRYLLIESSGKNATLPANLQGLWCHDFRPPWGSDYHTNINLQMNYWPACASGMAETIQPFVRFMEQISRFGKSTAKELFGARGWCVNHTTDVFGRTGVHDSVDCGFFPMAGAWLCLNLWEYYEYTGDISYLKRIYPILKGAGEFVCDYLTDDGTGRLVTAPSNSPENSFFYTDADGKRRKSMLTYGATIDFEIIYALFIRLRYVCKTLQVDSDFAKEIEQVLSKLPPLRVSERYGTICEWIRDYEETEPGHRHISHLYGLYPSDQINETDPVIYKAAKKTIDRRLENGSGFYGWSCAWFINFLARLKDSNRTYRYLESMIKFNTANNLLDIYCNGVFQIDGNFGAIAGINEMLIQSHLGAPNERIIELLPALPDAWRDGSIKGLMARGGFFLDMVWKNGKLSKVTIHSAYANTFRMKQNERTGSLKTKKSYRLQNAVIYMEFKENEIVEICF